MLSSLPNRIAWLKSWVVITRFTSFSLSFSWVYTVFILIPRFLHLLWLPSESQQLNIWVFQLFYFRGGLWLAFMITISIYTFFSVRSIGEYLWSRYIPPYDVNRDVSLPLPITYRSYVYDLERSKKTVITVVPLTALLLAFLRYIHISYFWFNAEIVTQHIRRIPENPLLPALLYMLQMPVDVFYDKSISEMNDLTLFNTLVYFWIPSIPFTIIMANVYNILYRSIRWKVYLIGRIVLSVLIIKATE